ncbi:dienelactone hydrolase family protein [Vulcanococcus limneticus]|uniref:dienelactone hydrolase family protein n=1 Tax=Vulcanococcus limneticus TaxID=2170428 RepID=UPI00398C15A9
MPELLTLPAMARPTRGEWVRLAVAEAPGVAPATIPAWWARPADGPPRAAVLVLPEVFGVNAWVRSVADRLAAAGYAALAISSFARTAPDLDVGYDAAGLEEGRRHRDQVTASQLLADVAAAAVWLQAAHGADGLGERPLGCVGFCFGGHLALIAATLPVIAATCDFYGARVSDFRPGMDPALSADAPGQPAPSLALVPEIPGRLWCFCGTADPLIPPAEQAAIGQALTQANGGEEALAASELPAGQPPRHRLILASGAGHGYLCEARGDFDPQAARAGWSAMLNLFAHALG